MGEETVDLDIAHSFGTREDGNKHNSWVQA